MGSLRPRKMKEIELTVLNRDIDAVIEFLGRHSLMHLTSDNDGSGLAEKAVPKQIQEKLEKLSVSAVWLGVQLPSEPWDSSHLPTETEDKLTDTISAAVSSLIKQENDQYDEMRKVEEALNEAKAFANLNAPFSDLDQLSYLTLRVGRLDVRRQEELKESLEGRAVVIPLGSGDRMLAAASRKGRFALDSELKKMDFIPIDIPEGYNGIPPELLLGLEERLKGTAKILEEINESKNKLRDEYALSLQSLTASYLMAGITEKLKTCLRATKNVYLLSGWVPADMVHTLVTELEKLTEGRIAVRSYNPEELDGVKEGREKVPVSLDHGAFVKGFENVVFSYGSPLYGTIDPTPLVAIFFTVLFGIMFGDLGQGFVLLLLGILSGRHGLSLLSRFRKFSVPLIAVGISSMVMGLLTGGIFCNEEILEGPTRAVTAFITGRPSDRILTIMPLPEKGGSVVKLFYFFGFTIGVGTLLNSAGLIVNVANQFFLKKYEKALFAKTGLAGLLLFWYAIFIAVRFAASLIKPALYTFSFSWFDAAGLVVPLVCIFFGSVIWRLFSGKRPIFPEGVMVFIMEGFVEVLETVSTNVSNTVSFLRVGAFALSHAVLAYIVFRFSEEVSTIPAGTAISVLIMIFGNVIIIVLEGLIVAIQVVRLQYYEFFSKFFTDVGLEFTPFRFRKATEQQSSEAKSLK
jgi:V/A-type H+/Na+-transporting ATPase subunit I